MKDYSAKEPGMKKGSDKDASAYKEMAGQKGIQQKKAAQLDSLGGTKQKNEPLYKACKDE